VSATSPKAVFFDFGGTLFSYRDMRSSTPELLASMLERLGVEADLRAAGRAYGKAQQAAFREFAARPFYLHRDLFHEAFRSFARSLGKQASPSDLEWCHVAQRRQVLEEFRLRDGCDDLIDALRRDGVHTAIVSNIDDDYLLPMLERCGLAEKLDAWTSSEEARSCKPDAAIFELALGKAGVAAEEVLFVGDSREHDIAGARALGMHTALIVEQGSVTPGAGGLAAAEPHREIGQLAELIPLLGVGSA
jgi:HAD superfamily hydrolase (TIGR01509 family)